VWRKTAAALALAGYFAYFNRDSFQAKFAEDEMLAIWVFWHPSPWRLLTSQFMLWRGYFRPLAGLFYMPIFLKFGLNPVPYKIGLLLLLALGAWLIYRVARVLGCGELTSGLAALIACYHAGLSNLYYNSVFVFDALCGVFYFASFLWYARIRAAGRRLTGRETAVFLALYLCTLNSKEMAVTLPVMLLVYEWIFVGKPLRPLWQWVRGPGRVIVWAGLLNVVYIYGKKFGENGIMKTSAYRPVFSRGRVLDFWERYLGDFFLNMPRFTLPAMLAVWALMTYLAWRRDRPILRFCWWWLVVTPLPIEFLIGRDQACLYVPLAGWAVFMAVVLIDLLSPAADFLAKEPLFLGLRRDRVFMLLVAVAAVAWAGGNRLYQTTQVTPSMRELAPQTWTAIEQFRAINPHARPHSQVVFLDDPLHTFDTAFIADLWFRDRSVNVRLNSVTPLTPAEIDKADHLFTMQDGKLIQIR
jgi:hypothetical protein